MVFIYQELAPRLPVIISVVFMGAMETKLTGITIAIRRAMRCSGSPGLDVWWINICYKYNS